MSTFGGRDAFVIEAAIAFSAVPAARSEAMRERTEAGGKEVCGDSSTCPDDL